MQARAEKPGRRETRSIKCARTVRLVLGLVLVAAVVSGDLLVGGLLAEGVTQARPALSKAASRRVILQLAGDPLAVTTPDTLSLEVARQELVTQQEQVARAIWQLDADVAVESTYQMALNGLAVRVPEGVQLSQLRDLDGVVAVYEETAYYPALHSSVEVIQAPAAWEALGGPAQAGAGVKIAVIDSGIAVDHPMFDPAGLTYPTGYPRGDVRYTTPKVIVSRAYFRPTEPPLDQESSPVPGPLGSSHGTHLAGIAAGVPVEVAYQGVTVDLSGVAPASYLMNYRIFYPSAETEGEAAFTVEVLDAIEDAVADGADVLCLGWASGAQRLPFASPVGQALEIAIRAGRIVVAAAGNDGPIEGSASRIPGGVEAAITVGATTKAAVIEDEVVDIVGPGAVPVPLQGSPYARALFGRPIAGSIGPLPYTGLDAPAGAVACGPLPGGSLDGHAALVPRGGCNFADKAYYAQQAGAEAVLIVNYTDDVETVACGGAFCDPGEIDIPVVMIGSRFAQEALVWLAEHPEATLQLMPDARMVPVRPDVILSQSARGPAFARYLKPDLLAPGSQILTAAHAVGDEPLYRQTSGTSMAAAHVAGVAALLRQAHPDWRQDDVKAALMATADQSVSVTPEGVAVSVLDRGAGRVDAAAALAPQLVLSPPSIAVPEAPPASRVELAVTMRDTRTAGPTQTYDVTAASSQGITIETVDQVTLAPGASDDLPLTVVVPSDAMLGDAEGQITLSAGEVEVHLPLWVHIAPRLTAADVLFIDNDFSYFEGYREYAGYIRGALEAAGISYVEWDADEHYDQPQTIPDLEVLEQYPAIIWVTGDHLHPDGYFVVSTPLTARDQEILMRYLDGGGRLLAMGQNLAQASDVNPSPDPVWGRSALYGNYFGAHWLQGHIFGPDTGQVQPPEEATVVGLPETFLAGMRLNIGPVGDGAANQTSVDEIAPGGVPDASDLDLVTPVMVAVEGDAVAEGYVGLAKADDPSLFDRVVSIPYRTLYYSFGLEGVNTAVGASTRVDLISRSVEWLLDEVRVALGEEILTAPHALTTIEANAFASLGGGNMRYRWLFDLGDDILLVDSEEPRVAHAFTNPGTYRVAVEVTDGLGHRAVDETMVRVVPGGSSTLALIAESTQPGDTLVYQARIENTGGDPMPITLGMPLPDHLEYVSHTGGTFADGVWRWSETLPAGTSTVARLEARIDSEAPIGAEIVAEGEFMVNGSTFYRRVTTAVSLPLFVPIVTR